MLWLFVLRPNREFNHIISSEDIWNDGSYKWKVFKFKKHASGFSSFNPFYSFCVLFSPIVENPMSLYREKIKVKVKLGSEFSSTRNGYKNMRHYYGKNQILGSWTCLTNLGPNIKRLNLYISSSSSAIIVFPIYEFIAFSIYFGDYLGSK